MTNLERPMHTILRSDWKMRSCHPEGIATAVEEFEHDGIGYEQGGVKVIAFTVDHGPAIKPAGSNTGP
jgi:ribonuclease Z